MAILAPTVPISARQKRVFIQNPGASVADGDGGFTQSWIDLPPPAFANVTAASQRSLERIAAGTVLSTATHLVTLPYRVGVTTTSRLLVDGRVLHVTSVNDENERHVELVLICAEVVP